MVVGDLQLHVPVQSRSWQGLLDTTLCDKVCQSFAAGWWLSLGILISSTNKTDCHVITEILLKVALNTVTLTPIALLTCTLKYVIMYE